VSPSWPKRVLIGLAPGEISVMTFSNGLRLKLEDAFQIEITADALQCEEPIVNALEDILSRGGFKGASFDVVLSNHLVHYLVIKSAPQIKNATERSAYALMSYKTKYGQAANDWDIRLASPDLSQPVIASAISQNLVCSVQKVTQAVGRLRTLRPLLMQSVNHSLKLFDCQEHLHVVVEPGRVTLVSYRNGEWQGVLTRMTEGSIEGTFLHYLDECASLLNHPPLGKVTITGFQHDRAVPEGEAGRTISSVPSPLDEKGGIKAKHLAQSTMLAAWGLA